MHEIQMLVVSVFSYVEDPTVKFLSKREQGDSRVKIHQILESIIVFILFNKKKK